MVEKYYLIKETDGDSCFSEAVLLNDCSDLKALTNQVSLSILQLVSRRAMYPAEVAKKLGIHEQSVYYHFRKLVSAGFVMEAERKYIRGTVAKKYVAAGNSFAFSLGKDWKAVLGFDKKKGSYSNFFDSFISGGVLDAHFVVGNPDPHGPHKARARDGHYAIDLAMFLGGFCSLSQDFSVKLDVDSNDEFLKQNLIVVGGPVTNSVMSLFNQYMPVKFSDKRPWGLISKYDKYTDDTVGLIVKMPNPFNTDKWVLMIAGIRFIGTKAAIMALTRHHGELLRNYHGQKTFVRLVQGFDLDGDGKIDSVEILE